MIGVLYRYGRSGLDCTLLIDHLTNQNATRPKRNVVMLRRWIHCQR
jgi:hypothetical protein